MTARVIRALTDSGLERLRAYLGDLRHGATRPPPYELLDDPGATRELPVEIDVEPRPFASRLALGMYLNDRLAPLDAEEVDVDAGLWAWLALYFLDAVAPARADGVRRPGQDYRHVPSFDFRTAHRHLLYGPYQVYRRHGDTAALLLSGPPHRESGIYHEIAGRRDLIANRGVLEAASLLYYDPARRAPRPGAQGSLTDAGSVRRFVRVLQQLDMTYDIYGLSGEQLLELLPPEFDAWRPQRELEFGGADAHAPAAAAHAADFPGGTASGPGE